jgi:hypothetical protein
MKIKQHLHRELKVKPLVGAESRRQYVAMGPYLFCDSAGRRGFRFSGNCQRSRKYREIVVLYFSDSVPGFAARRITAAGMKACGGIQDRRKSREEL